MKKLYRKGTVHPSPPIISDHLSFLPAAILTLAAALSPDDREVLAYLISFSSSNPRRTTPSASAAEDHSPLFSCSCFRCYTSYWVRWDSSPNRQLIDEIIDSFEEWLQSHNTNKNKRNKRSNNTHTHTPTHKHKHKQQPAELTRPELLLTPPITDSPDSELVFVESSKIGGEAEGGGGGEEEEEEEDSVEESEEAAKGSVRRFVSFIGEKIWGAAWGQ